MTYHLIKLEINTNSYHISRQYTCQTKNPTPIIILIKQINNLLYLRIKKKYYNKVLNFNSYTFHGMIPTINKARY